MEDPATEGKEGLEKEVQCWEGRMNARKAESFKNYRRKYTSKAVKDTKTTNKRSKDDLVESMEEDLVKGKAKKRRYSLMSLKWGEEYEPVSIPSLPDLQAYEPLPQRTSGRLRGSNRVPSLPSPGLLVSGGSA